MDPKRLLRSHIKKSGRKMTPAPQHQAQPGPGGDPGSQTARRGRGRGSTTPRGEELLQLPVLLQGGAHKSDGDMGNPKIVMNWDSNCINIYAFVTFMQT